MRGLLILCLSGALFGQTTATTATAPSKTTTTSKTMTTKTTTAAKTGTTGKSTTAAKTATAAKSTTAAKTTTAPKTAKPAPAALALATDSDKTIYALGLLMYQRLGEFSLSGNELEILKQALSDGAAGKPAVKLEEWGPKIQTLAKERQTQAAAKQKLASQGYLTKAAAEPGAVKTESGLIYRELRAGTGKSPAASDTVKVHYRGTLTDGTEFDSSYKRNEPASFPLDHVIKCWTEGVQRMKVGGKAQLVCPADLAYGDRAQATIPAGSTLVFEVELLDISAGAGK